VTTDFRYLVAICSALNFFLTSAYAIDEIESRKAIRIIAAAVLRIWLLMSRD
jgi:hypothetical protein